jgi:hypothetical protein
MILPIKNIFLLQGVIVMQKLFNILFVGLFFTVLQVTNVGAQAPAAPGSVTGDPCMVVPAGPDRDACYATTPPPTGMAPTGTPGMPPTGMAPTGTPGMPPTGMAPSGTTERSGISGWIKGGLKALGIGADDAPAGTPNGAGAGDPCMVVPAGSERDACYAK